MKLNKKEIINNIQISIKMDINYDFLKKLNINELECLLYHINNK
jgi:hypothetical protein